MHSDSDLQLQPVRRQTTSERVAQTVRGYIDGRLEPGDRLPAERQLCQMLGVGRTTLREAMRILQSEGRVTVRAGSGAYVTVPGETTPFAHWSERLDVTVESLLQVRLLLEPAAAALAATASLTREEKAAALTGPLETMAAATAGDQLERRVAADLAFHNAVARMSGNTALLSTLQELATPLAESRRVSLSYEQRLTHVQDAHLRIRDAIVDGDADAASAAMVEHLAAFGVDMGLGAADVMVPASAMRSLTIARLLEEHSIDARARDLE